MHQTLISLYLTWNIAYCIPNNMIQEHFNTSQCKDMYSTEGLLLYPNRSYSREFDSFIYSENVPYVFEDLYRGRRYDSTHYPHHPAQEVTINNEFKFVYITNRKAGSSTIHELILKHLQTPTWKGCTSLTQHCIIKKRCTSRCLTDTMLHHYYFFTFVRNPWDRFLSSLKQMYYVLSHSTKKKDREHAIRYGNVSFVTNLLKNILATHIVGDQHFET